MIVPMAIGRYPTDLERTTTLRNGVTVRLRAIRPNDDEALRAMFERLSEQTIYQRFFTARRWLPPAWLQALTHVDYHARLALVAELETDGETRLVGVGRYDVSSAPDAAEVALVVEDAWQGLGLGTILLHAIMRAGEARDIRRFRLDVLSDNRRMLRLLARETAVVSRRVSGGVTEAVVESRP